MLEAEQVPVEPGIVEIVRNSNRKPIDPERSADDLRILEIPTRHLLC